MEEITTNRQHKDRFFKKVFEDKKDLLSLYNAINGTDYYNPDDIEVNTIEDFFFMGMKNDVSFLIANVMNLYEQQSSINPNMPLRGFLYLAKLYQKYFGNHTDIYSSKLIKLPVPHFIVFYNGTDKEEDRRILRMSEAFEGPMKEKSSLECIAYLININYGHNMELLEKCENLKGYSMVVEKVRYFLATEKDREKAVEKAIDECINEDILADILEKHRAEAKAMILEEYDEELHIKNEKEISYEDGFADGHSKGHAEGRKEGHAEGDKNRRILDLTQMLFRGGTDDDLRKFHDANDEEIALAKKELAQKR